MSSRCSATAAAGDVSPEGTYEAGPNAGDDIILVEDMRSGERVEVRVQVVPGAVFGAESRVLFVPLGQTYQLAARGGSGHIEAQANDTVVRVEAGRVTPKTPGVSAVTVRDAFTGEQAEVTIHVVERLGFEERPAGDLGSITRVRAGFDLDGDSWPDAVVGHPESDLGGWRSGAVYVYRGSAQGLRPGPAQVLPGAASEDQFGRAVQVADLDGDGQPDLIVGAPLVDIGGSNTGTVQVYRGVEGGFFEAEPWQQWAGDHANDQFGGTLAVCDFNGDEQIDVAVGAEFDEDRNAQPTRGNQGGVRVFLNSAGSFTTDPNVDLWGSRLNGQGDWVGEANLRLGRALAAGDVDGDGLCDLAAASDLDDEDGNSNSGAVFVYRGQAPADSLGLGGLEETPALALRHPQQNARYGFRVSVGDVDEDGRAELLVGAFNHNSGGEPSRGAAYLHAGRVLGSEPADAFTSAVGDAVWSLQGDQRFDQLGWDVALAQVDGVGGLELLVSSPNDELDGQPGSTGTIKIFLGGPLDQIGQEPAAEVRGMEGGDRLGQGLDTSGQDVDGDGLSELVAFAARADTFGLDAGQPALVPTAASPDAPGHTILELDELPAGSWVGYHAELIGDVSGDGVEDLAVGAPFYEPPGVNQVNAGAVLIYHGQRGGGFSLTPAQVLGGFPTYSATDLFGWQVAGLGDFDGDGHQDLAVIARDEDRPRTYGGAQTDMQGQTYYENGTWRRNTCAARGGQSNVGGVYVFRGTGGGLEPSPSWIIHGRDPFQRISTVAGAGDVNGDGRDDLVYGSETWDDGANNGGGFAVVLGRAAPQGDKITPICAPSRRLLSSRGGDQLGSSLTGLGDLNGDGCADFAVGAFASDVGGTNQGHVRVILSQADQMGPGCVLGQAQVIALAPGANGALAGSGLAGGGGRRRRRGARSGRRGARVSGRQRGRGRGLAHRRRLSAGPDGAAAAEPAAL